MLNPKERKKQDRKQAWPPEKSSSSCWAGWRRKKLHVHVAPSDLAGWRKVRYRIVEHPLFSSELEPTFFSWMCCNHIAAPCKCMVNFCTLALLRASTCRTPALQNVHNIALHLDPLYTSISKWQRYPRHPIERWTCLRWLFWAPTQQRTSAILTSTKSHHFFCLSGTRRCRPLQRQHVVVEPGPTPLPPELNPCNPAKKISC